MFSQQSVFNTFLGSVHLAGNNDQVCSLQFGDTTRREVIHPGHRDASVQIRQYLSGDRRHFDIPLNPQGTIFQQKVWKRVTAIPYGKTLTYAELAGQCGKGANPRNVGGANGANPMALLIPCHRVVGRRGELTGYAWGVERKRKLLELEGALPQLRFFE